MPDGTPRPERVLIVRLGAIGDVVNALTVATALKRGPRPPEIGWAVHELALPLVEGHPAVDRVHLWRKADGFAGFRSVLRDVRAAKYDVAVDLQRIAKSAALARLSRAPRVLGWDRARSKEGAWLFATERIPAGDPERHMIEHYREFARALGLEDTEPERVLPDVPAAEAWLQEGLTEETKPLIVLNVGASKPGNRWPAERFGEVAAGLEIEGYAPLLTGGPDDQQAGARAVLGAGGAALDLTGATDLAQLTALLRRALLFIGCDTGPMHMAAAVGTPVLAIFGPANPERTGPWGAGHRVLQHLPPGGKADAWRGASTEDVTAAEVLGEALAMLGR